MSTMNTLIGILAVVVGVAGAALVTRAALRRDPAPKEQGEAKVDITIKDDGGTQHLSFDTSWADAARLRGWIESAERRSHKRAGRRTPAAAR
jgi:hypothetical protein